MVYLSNTTPFMSATTYLELPVEGLYRLLIVATREMVEASDSKKSDAIIQFRAKKKQVQLLLDTIEERRAMDDEERRARNDTR